MSDIRFNNWKHQSGTGGVTQNSGGNVGIGSTLPSSKLDVGGDGKFTGVVTATSFSGSGANLTSLPAGQLTGALPAISGANLTGISQVGGANSVRFNDDVKAFFGSSSSTDCEIVRNSNAVAGQTSLTVKSDLPFIVSTTNTSSIQFYVNNNSGNNGLIFDNNGLKPSSNNNVKLGSSSYKYNSLYAVNVFATTLFGDGSNLTGIDSGIPGISTTGISTFRDVQVGGAMTCTGTIVNKIDATTENAVVIGFEANKNNTNTDGSVIIGHRAGYQNATGKGYNTFLGYYAGYAGGGTQGAQNVMVGSGCGMFMYDNASYNVAMGVNAGYYNNETYCVSIGANSGYSREAYNTAIGGYANGPGNQMDSNYMTYPANNNATQSGENNICIGYQSNTPNSSASNYIVIGNKKNTNFVVGTLGVEVTAGVTTHSGSVVVGAGVSVVGIVTAANFLKADGSAVGGVTSDATYNTIGGTGAGNALTSNARDNTFFGHEAGNDVTSGDYNSIFGAGAGELINTGGHNTLLGADAGRKMTAGSDNTCIGKSAGEDLGTGSFGTNISGCVMIGKEAGKSMQSGNYNVMVGYQAGQHMLSGRSNICMGYLAGQGTYNNCTGSYNIAIGESNLYTVQGGSYNHVVGRYAGHSITSGSYNICIGDKAGAVNTYNGNSGDLTTGSNNIIIGKEAQASSATVSNEITLGNSSITTFRVPGIGFNASGTGHLDVTGNSARFRTIESGGATVEIRSGGSEGYVGTSSNHKVSLITNSTRRWEISGAGHFIPYANDTYDIGSSSNRVRDIYTGDLNLSNVAKKDKGGNDVDGTWGDFTIQEGESDLFLINNRSGKKYKFNLTEVS